MIPPIPANKKPAQEHAAVWVPDSDASTCMHCLKTKFTPINRRVSSRRLFNFCKPMTQYLLYFSITVESVELLCVVAAQTRSSFFLTSQQSLCECALAALMH